MLPLLDKGLCILHENCLDWVITSESQTPEWLCPASVQLLAFPLRLMSLEKRCVCVCVSYACVCTYVCRRLCLCVHAEVRSWPWVSSCLAPHLTFWDVISDWSLELTDWLDWLDHEPLAFSCLCLTALRFQVHAPRLAFYMWMLTIKTQVLLLVEQVFAY